MCVRECTHVFDDFATRVNVCSYSFIVLVIVLVMTHLLALLVLPGLREKLGDTKDQVRDQTQLLIQQIMQNVSGTAQVC